MLSVDGLLHREAEHFLKRMAANLAHKWEKPYSQTCGYVRARLAFAIIRATSLCLRGSRVKWRSGLGMDDGAPLYYFAHLYLHNNEQNKSIAVGLVSYPDSYSHSCRWITSPLRGKRTFWF